MNLKRKLFVVGLVITICACDSNNVDPVKILSNYHTGANGLTFESEGFINKDISYDMNELRSLYSDLMIAINDQDVSKTQSCLNKVEDSAGELVDKMAFARIKYYANPNDENKSLFQELTNYYYDYFDIDDESLFAALDTKNEDIINILFASYSEEEKAQYTGEISRISELSEKVNMFSLQAEELYSEKDENENFEEDALDLFYENIDDLNAYGEEKGYENFLEERYKNTYSRKYTINDTKSLVNSIKRILLCVFQPTTLTNLSKKDKERVLATESDSFSCDLVDLGNYIDDYANAMGGNFLQTYEHAFTDGYIVFSDRDNSKGSASNSVLVTENENILYFPKTHQTATSVIHEFGHYNAYVNNPINRSRSLDINETFSIGNEILFANFMDQNYEGDFFDAYKESKIDHVFKTLFKSVYAVECENYLFENYQTKSKREILEAFHTNFIDNYSFLEMFDEDYWVYPTMVDTGYYISYVTSAIESLQLCIQCKTNFETAKNNYLKLVNNNSFDDDIKLWKDSGFDSPFLESTLYSISDIIAVR